MNKKQQYKVGDIIALEWADIVSYGRIESGHDSELPVAMFLSYGEVSYADNERLILVHEKEITSDKHRMREPTVYPIGCIRKVTRLRA